MDNYRFYSFVAGLYLSPLQCGLQTAHAVSEMYVTRLYGQQRRVFADWAEKDKTIIICSAVNSKGVLTAHAALKEFGDEFDLPVSLFCEDSDSLNGAATAAAIVVPRQFYDVKLEGVFGEPGCALYRFERPDGNFTLFVEGSKEFEFISFLKSFRLA